MAAQEPGKVLIVGAGPAGMSLAYLLSRRGIGVTVVESHHDFTRNFRGEGLQRSGIDAFRQMGLGERFDRIPFVEIKTIDMFALGRLCVRAGAEGLGRGQVRLVPQAARCKCSPTRPASTLTFDWKRALPFETSSARMVGLSAFAPTLFKGRGSLGPTS